MSALADAQLALLGVKGGPAIRPGSAMPTSHLLRLGGASVLVDAGLGAAQGVVRQGVGLHQLDAILVTHLHSDHYLELGPLLHTAWTAGLKRRLPVWGPKGLDAYWRHFCEAMRFDIELRIADEGRPDLRALVEINEIGGQAFTAAGLSVTPMLNDHPPITESYALRVEGAGRSVVFSGDTAPLPGMAGFARGADLLVHESMLVEGVEALVARVGNGDDRLRRHIMRSHTSVQDAARIGAEAGVRGLALNHLLPSDDPAFTEADFAAAGAGFPGTLIVGRDGLRIDLATLETEG